MGKKFQASIIIPTYNGASKIANLLDGLTKQTEMAFEIIIVVDGSTDNTAEVVEPFRKKFGDFKIVFQENKGRAYVRNRGVQEAISDLFIFYDDDMIPFPDSVHRHIQFHNETTGLLTGNPVEDFKSQHTDIQSYKASLTAKWLAKYSHGRTSLGYDNIFFTAANCSIKKKDFEFLKGFDERLTDSEDYDLAYRSLQLTIPVYYDHDNKAYHNDPVTAVSYVKRLRAYRESKEKLNVLYPNRPYTVHRKRILKSLVYGAFASAFWLKVIDRHRLTFLPTTLRYKLYDIIFHSLSVEYPNVPL
jgi:glycosyltransferase involved in cell wall biosynthesis